MKHHLTRLVATLACLIASPLPAHQAETPPAVAFASTELAPGLHMIEAHGGFGGGNVGVSVGADGVVMIDDSFPPYSADLLAAVAKLAPGSIAFVINTHVHGDHSGGNQILTAAGATIVAHNNVRGRMVEQGISNGTEMVPAPADALPVITFADAMTFHLNGREAFVFHVEHAHTDGDAIIHYRDADVIHAGDVFFNHLYPFIDLDSGGSLDGYIAAQKRILELATPTTKIIPGHGALASKSDLEASIAMLEAAKARIAKLIAEGMSLEQVLEANPLADFDSYSWMFITTESMTKQIYRGLGGS